MVKRLLTVSEPGRDGVFFCVRDWLRYLRENCPDMVLDLAYSSKRSSPELDAFLGDFSGEKGERVDLKITGSPQWGDLSALVKIYGMVRRHRPELIHAHSSKAGGLVRLLGLLPGMPPMVYTPHAYFGMGGQAGLKGKFFTVVERVLYPLATTICCSEDEAAFAMETLGVPENRLVVCHHGLPEAAFRVSTEEERREARKELGLPLKGRILLTVGRDALQKNYAPLYEAIPSLFLETNFFLAHVGLGSTVLRDSLPDDCRARIFAWEHLLKERMPLLYRAADGFIMTSRYEGFSLAVLEALAEGLPLILTDVPGFRVYRKLGFDSIYWVPLDKPDFYPALVRSLVEWENSGCSRLPVQAGRAREFFLQSRQHRKLEAIYEKVCRDSRGTR